MYYNSSLLFDYLRIKKEYNVSQNWYDNMLERILTFDITYKYISIIIYFNIFLEYETGRIWHNQMNIVT